MLSKHVAGSIQIVPDSETPALIVVVVVVHLWKTRRKLTSTEPSDVFRNLLECTATIQAWGHTSVHLAWGKLRSKSQERPACLKRPKAGDISLVVEHICLICAKT